MTRPRRMHKGPPEALRRYPPVLAPALGEPETPAVKAAALPLVLVAVLLASCSEEQAQPVERVQSVYLVRYEPSTYDRERVNEFLQRCVTLPGASRGDQTDSLPPIHSVLFRGPVAQQTAVEDCLTSIPSGQVTDRDSGRAIRR